MRVVLYDYLMDSSVYSILLDKGITMAMIQLPDWELLFSSLGLAYAVQETGGTLHAAIANLDDSDFACIEGFYTALGYKIASVKIKGFLCKIFTFAQEEMTLGQDIGKDCFVELIKQYKTQGTVDIQRKPARKSATELSKKTEIQRVILLQERQRKLIAITLISAFVLSLCAIILFLIHSWSVSSDRVNANILDEFNPMFTIASGSDVVTNTKPAATSQGMTFNELVFDPNEVKDINELDTTKLPVEPEAEQQFLQLNWDELKQKYPNIVGWLYIPGVEINYPVAQGTDNEFFLTHLIDGRKGLSGWLFSDYRLQNKTPEKNYIIFGHNMADGSMFGHLKHVLWENWWSNPDNQYIYWATENYTAVYQVCNAMTVVSSEVYYHRRDLTDENFVSYMQDMTSRNQLRTQLTHSQFYMPADRIITLSTCNDSEGAQKFVLQGTLKAIQYTQ